jgi:hypothetical protein
VPLAGQAAFRAMVGYATLRYLGEQHIKDCVARGARQAGLSLAGADPGKD